MKPLKHQEKFVSGYKGKNLLVHEAGTGKTVCACLWLKDGRDNNAPIREKIFGGALVICPKRVVKKWEAELIKWVVSATVLSKEEFKKYPLMPWSSVVIDECDWFASPLFSKGRSQLTTKMYELVKTYKPQMLLLSATPIRSNPWNLHTLLCLGGHYIDWKKWRSYFFELKKLPYLPRPAWLPKNNWRKLIRPILEKHADIVLMKDCVDSIPAIQEYKIQVEKDEFVNTEWEGSKAFFEEHRHEQKHKLKYIVGIAREYRKVMVVAYYTEQIAQLKKELSKEREVFVLQGGVKDQEAIIKAAQESDECYFIVQASVGEGFDADSFSCVVFASMSYAVRDYVQMKARVRRIHNLHPVVYYYLLAGNCDKGIFKNVMMGKSFVPSEYRYEPSKPTEAVQAQGSEDR